MADTGTLHGALVFIRRDERRVALARDVRLRVTGPLGSVDPIGQPHPEEHLRLASEVELEFSVYRRENASIVSQQLFPSMASAKAFIEHPETDISIESNNDTMLHRITGFKVEDYSVSYTKGEPSSYEISGKGIFHFDEADNP